MLRTACGVQSFGDFLLAFLHGLGDRRPYVLHAKPDENSEGERLTEQRQVNVHSDIPRAISFDAVVNSTATGLAMRTPSGTGKVLSSDNEDEVHRDTNTDHRYGVEQTSHQEGLGLQLRSQLGLTSSGFQQLTAQQSEANASAQGTQTDHERGGDVDEFHVKLLKLRVKVFLVKRNVLNRF
ncbi:conserved hypothetical protein [Pseudomonas sp. 9Ag]|nr:conserved hypothetical protein [Pseudomonas sp. 9Ag]